MIELFAIIYFAGFCFFMGGTVTLALFDDMELSWWDLAVLIFWPIMFVYYVYKYYKGEL